MVGYQLAYVLFSIKQNNCLLFFSNANNATQ